MTEQNSEQIIVPADMIKTQLATQLTAAVEKFNEEFYNRSYSGRHPELGKMVNCPVCSLRHRSSEVCHQVFVEGSDVFDGMSRVAAHKGKRINPHYSHRRLQLVQLTQQIFHEEFSPFFNDHVQSMHSARSIAKNRLKKIRDGLAAGLRHRQDVSRRINRGLLPAGAR